MIFKSVRRPTPAKTLGYASRDGQALHIGGTMSPKTPLLEVVAEFERVHALRPELRSKKIIHKSIALAEQDRPLTPIEMGEIARRTVERLDLADGPWMAWFHSDGRTPHIHIVGSSIRYDGGRVETGDHYKRQMALGRELELEYGLWRAPMKKGGLVLPPLQPAAIVMPGPTLTTDNPIEGPGFRKLVKDAVFSTLREAPGLSLPELRERLAAKGVELVVKFNKDQTKINGLGFRAGHSYEDASKVDKGFSLAGLQKAGVVYVPERDFPSFLEVLGPPAAAQAPEPIAAQASESTEDLPAVAAVVAVPEPRPVAVRVAPAPARPTRHPVRAWIREAAQQGLAWAVEFVERMGRRRPTRLDTAIPTPSPRRKDLTRDLEALTSFLGLHAALAPGAVLAPAGFPRPRPLGTAHEAGFEWGQDDLIPGFGERFEGDFGGLGRPVQLAPRLVREGAGDAIPARPGPADGAPEPGRVLHVDADEELRRLRRRSAGVGDPGDGSRGPEVAPAQEPDSRGPRR
jgi:hypothetical protein